MKVGRKRVLFVLSSLKFGGMEKHTIALLNGLDTARFELSLACLRREDDLLPQLDTSRLAHCFVIEARSTRPCRRGPPACLAARGAAGHRNLRQRVPDAVRDARVARNPYPPRLVDIFHTTVYRTAKERLQLFIYRRLFRRMDLLIYVSAKQQQYWRTHGLRPRQDLLIHNGIDVRRFRDAAAATGAPAVRAACGFAPETT